MKHYPHYTRKDAARFCDKLFSAGYCELQKIISDETKRGYNSGVYGWNWNFHRDFVKIRVLKTFSVGITTWTRDVPQLVTVGITTGYRNTAGAEIPRELIAEFNRRRDEIDAAGLFAMDYTEKRRELEHEFFAALATL